MNLFRSLTLTFSLYSAIPMPNVRWEEENMQWVFPCLPVVGGVIGGVLWLWLRLTLWLELGQALTGAVALLLPIALSGGIHLDGLCDTCDALGSHQSRERKLEIMKDSHIGAFGVIGCALYLLLFFAAWLEVNLTADNLVLLAVIPVVSRSWTALSAVTRKNARGSGLLATFTDAAATGWNRLLCGLWLGACLVFLLCWSAAGRWAAACSALVALVFYHMTKREFGGLTGDLAGCQLQLLELGMVLAVAVVG
ncbi:MAG: adenosylcobinamide-GDP ribazoletransferase [Clostridiales bacterium]|nr:adenosylcobinamide-GDP ribazoletransferase [Clostridiales bacterium]